jgi:NTP pyrophosphatase (non-canonical NTP hydrolase)
MTSLPPIFDESELNHEYWLKEENLADRDPDNLKQIIRDLAGKLKARFNENKQLNAGYDRLREYCETLKKTNREMDERSLRRIQIDVGEWRKAAYPDTATLELQTLGVSEETGELAHAVLKYKQGIRGYDFEKTKAEAADAIGDIIIYAMGAADCLDISVEEALYSTAQHVISRNITQDSDAGNDTLIGHTDSHGRPNGVENIPPYHANELCDPTPKGVDYAGHMPADEGSIIENKPVI